MGTGERIRTARLNKGYTQEELGKLIGVQRAAINKYETGVISNLKRSTIAALAKALDVRPSYLMCMDEEPAPAVPCPRSTESVSISETEQRFLESFRQLNEEGQQKVLSYIEDLLRAGIYKRDHEHFMVSKDA